MIDFIANAAGWLRDSSWAHVAAASALVVLTAVCAACMARARSMASSRALLVLCVACVAAAAVAVWTRYSDYGWWCVARLAERGPLRFSGDSYNTAQWSGSAARTAWLRAATAEVEVTGQPVGLTHFAENFSQPNRFPDFTKADEHRATLLYAEQYARVAMQAAAVDGRAQQWFSAHRSAWSADEPLQFAIMGPRIQVSSGWGNFQALGKDELVPDIDGIEYGVIIRRVEWRDAHGEWHAILDRPTPLTIDWRARWESVVLVQTPDIPALEVRCSGDFVISSEHILESRTIPLEWAGPVH